MESLVAFTRTMSKCMKNKQTNKLSSLYIYIDNEHQQQQASNRKILSSIIKCILFIDKQNLPFRGYDDDGIAHNSLDNFVNVILMSNKCTF